MIEAHTETAPNPAPRAVSKEIAIKHVNDGYTSRRVLLKLTKDWAPWVYQVNSYGRDGKIHGSCNYDADRAADALAEFGISIEPDGILSS